MHRGSLKYSLTLKRVKFSKFTFLYTTTPFSQSISPLFLPYSIPSQYYSILLPFLYSKLEVIPQITSSQLSFPQVSLPNLLDWIKLSILGSHSLCFFIHCYGYERIFFCTIIQLISKDSLAKIARRSVINSFFFLQHCSFSSQHDTWQLVEIYRMNKMDEL